MPSSTEVEYSWNAPPSAPPRQIRNTAGLPIGFASRLFHLLDYGGQLIRHRRQRTLFDHHFASASPPDDDVVLAPLRFLLGEVFTELRPAAFLAEKSGTGDRFGHDDHVLNVDRRVPAVVVLTVAANTGALSARAQLIDILKRPLHFALDADNADEILHRLLQVVLHQVGIFGGRAALERRQRGGCR